MTGYDFEWKANIECLEPVSNEEIPEINEEE